MGEKLLALALEGPAQAFLSSRRGSLLGLWSREVRLQDWQGPRKERPLLREAPAAWGHPPRCCLRQNGAWFQRGETGGGGHCPSMPEMVITSPPASLTRST